MNRKKLYMLLGLCLVFTLTVAARYSRYQAPQWIELISGDSWAWRVSDSSEVVRFQIDTDGTPNLYNSSGTKVWGVSALGANESLNRETETTLTWDSTYGFNITLAESASIYKIDVSDATNSSAGAMDSYSVSDRLTAGTTVTLPTPTEALNGTVFTILKIDSATTDLVLWAGGLPIVSGTTDQDMDAIGNSMTLMADYNSAVSYWILNDSV
jgi:hypothetical protein